MSGGFVGGKDQLLGHANPPGADTRAGVEQCDGAALTVQVIPTVRNRGL